MLYRQRDERVTGLMIGHPFLVAGGHYAILFLEAEHDTIDGFFQIRHLNLIAVSAYSQQCCFVDDIGEIRPNHARRAGSYDLQVGVGRELDLAHMNFEYGFTPFEVRPVDDDLTIESPGSHQRCIQHLRCVGCSHDDDAL